jgi:hypothetical protein
VLPVIAPHLPLYVGGWVRSLSKVFFLVGAPCGAPHSGVRGCWACALAPWGGASAFPRMFTHIGFCFVSCVDVLSVSRPLENCWVAVCLCVRECVELSELTTPFALTSTPAPRRRIRHPLQPWARRSQHQPPRPPRVRRHPRSSSTWSSTSNSRTGRPLARCASVTALSFPRNSPPVPSSLHRALECLSVAMRWPCPDLITITVHWLIIVVFFAFFVLRPAAFHSCTHARRCATLPT